MRERHFTFTLNVRILNQLNGSRTAAYKWIRKFCEGKDFQTKGDSDYICLHWMNDRKTTDFLIEFNAEFPWFFECKRWIDMPVMDSTMNANRFIEEINGQLLI